jgi:hypothetical protein
MKFYLALLLLLSCGTIPINIMKSTFGHIKGYYKIKTKSIDNCIQCYSSIDDYLRIKHVNSQLAEIPYITASSFVLTQKKSETFLMTSGHVCNSINSFITQEKYKKFSLAIQDMIFKSKDLFENDELNSFYYVDIQIEVYAYNGEKFKLKEIKYIDNQKDLCILSTESKWGTPVKFAKKKCEYEEVYNMSTSGGYYYPNAVPIRKGFINNIIDKQKFNDVIFEDVNLYTLSVKPGASGSAVFNSKGEVCGNINISYSNLDLSSGASLKDIITFFQMNKNSL